ncbi:MAG: M3 family metallopeptidase [Candidatus Thorarchaeota archaeon]
MSEKEIAWDLREIFAECDDPKISETMDDLMKKADEIIDLYKGKINLPSFTSQNLHDLLIKHEEILAGVEEIEIFSYNSFNANSILPETKAILNKYLEFQSSISKKLAFLEIEIGKYIYKNPEIVDEESLWNYKNYLGKILRKFPYKLSETEEQLILDKDQFGAKAWQQLRASWITSKKIKAIVEGEEKIISFSELFSLWQHPDRKTRISVFQSHCDSLKKNEEIYTSALRNICNDWVKTSNRRHYESPIHQSLIDNETTQVIIDNMMRIIEENLEVYQRFLRIKTKLFNLPKLGGVDAWARLPSKKKYTWDESKEFIIQVFDTFDHTFGEYSSDIFKRNHIDASARDGKSGGAYCSPWYNGKSAFILTTFKGLLGDVVPLAHELGHGIHSYFSSQEQTFFNYIPTFTVAETASTFGELLMTEHLLKDTKETSDKISLLYNQLNWAGMIIFHLSARMWFEQSLYDAIINGDFLDGETISKYWCAARDKIYGDKVKWLDEMKWEWAATGHYFRTDLRFYNYPYIYAQLFVYALYQTFKKEGKAFIPKFKKLLSAGSSMSPEELGKIVGLDIIKPDFWRLGMRQYESFVDKLEKLTK